MNYKYYITLNFREATAGREQVDAYYGFISKHKARRLKGGRVEGTSKLVMRSRTPLTIDGFAKELKNIVIVCFEGGLYSRKKSNSYK